MATSQQLLTSVEAAILAFTDGGAVEEYQLAGGRRIRRSQLSELLKMRDKLKVEIARANRSPVRVGSLGRARGTSR